MAYENDYYFILKDIWETWAAANDPDGVHSAHLTEDETCYIVVLSVSNSEQKARLLAIQSCLQVTRSVLKDFQNNNKDMFSGPDVGSSAAARGVPVHPNDSSLGEMENLYDGTTGTMVYNSSGDSTWTIPLTTMAGGLDDVSVADDFIYIPNVKLGPTALPGNDNEYIYYPSGVWIHTWPIVSASIVGSDVEIKLTIPAP